MRARSLSWIIPLILCSPLVAPAQQGVRQERLTFIGTTLEIEVLAESPGTLRLIQGRAGEIDVSARAVAGIAGFGLSGGDRGKLQLTAVGAERVEYLVVIPEGAQVRIRLPGNPVAQTLGTLQKTAVYNWGNSVERRDSRTRSRR